MELQLKLQSDKMSPKYFDVIFISFTFCTCVIHSLHDGHEMNAQWGDSMCLSACFISESTERISWKFGVGVSTLKFI